MGDNPPTWPDKIRCYEIGEQLGQGAFSFVCKCRSTKTGDIYAIKIFPKANLGEQGDSDRFQREIDTMAFLKHDNLVTLYDFFWDEVNFYLVIDFCAGGELFDFIVDRDKLDEDVSAVVFQQILSAITACHDRGVAHRDLKPENVLIVDFPRVKVADFGLCGFIKDEQMMKTFCGSPCYCSPECLCRIQYDGRKSDIWSLGVILYEMVTGQHPWNISNTSIMLRQILKGAYTVPSFVSPQCKDLITSMMKVNPGDRLTLDKIARHPWMKRAESVPHLESGSKGTAPFASLSISELSQLSARSSSRSENGIICPFEDDDGQGVGPILGDDDKGAAPGMPRLCVKSASVQNLGHAGGVPTSSSQSGGLSMAQRRRFGPTTRTNMAQTRQRSAVNLLAGRTQRGGASRRATMMTIAEDDD